MYQHSTAYSRAEADKKKQRWKGKIWADELRGVAKEASLEGNRDGVEKRKRRRKGGYEDVRKHGFVECFQCISYIYKP